jgi:hypothetical protein
MSAVRGRSRPRTIAQVLQLWDTGLAMKAAAERLNADGVPSASGQPDWSVAKVQTAPKSLTAQGQYKGRGILSVHPSLNTQLDVQSGA